MPTSKTVLLRNKLTQDSEPFEATHAQRVLAYPKSVYEAVDGPAKETGPKPSAKPEKPALAVATAAADAAKSAPVKP